MPISNEEYQDFTKKIAEKDNEYVLKTIEEVRTIEAAFEGMRTKLESLRNSMPESSGNSARSATDSVINQLLSFFSQSTYLINSLESVKLQKSPTA